jgi:hypothetical protein
VYVLDLETLSSNQSDGTQSIPPVGCCTGDIAFFERVPQNNIHGGNISSGNNARTAAGVPVGSFMHVYESRSLRSKMILNVRTSSSKEAIDTFIGAVNGNGKLEKVIDPE